MHHARIQRGWGQGSGLHTPDIGFLSNTGPDSLKNHKTTKQHSMLGHHRHASEQPFKWHEEFNDEKVFFLINSPHFYISQPIGSL